MKGALFIGRAHGAAKRIDGRGVVALAFAFAAILYGGSKPGQTQKARARAMLSASATVETTAAHPFAGEPALVGKWWRRGAYDDGEIVEIPESAGWRFPWRGGHLTRFEIWANGAVYASERDEEPVARLRAPLSLKPMSSRVVHGFATNGAYRVEWRGAHPNRDHDVVTDAAVELRRNGDVVLEEGGAATLVPYEIPFAHAGFGQDEAWVRANYADAADEILSAGYSDWVDGQVGEGLENGLYRFTATFSEPPPEATELRVGDFSVCVTNAGAYSFLLEKGVRYNFQTSPFYDAVVYDAQDDAADSSAAMPSLATADASGGWSIDGGGLDLEIPSRDAQGRCLWMPTLQGSPNVPHVGIGDSSVVFSAMLSDYCGSATPQFRWHSSDSSIVFTSPDEQDTGISLASMPSWRSASLSVQAGIGAYSLVSYLNLSCGTNASPQVHLSMSVPEGIAAGGARREVKVGLAADCATNGTVALRCVGGADSISLWTAQVNGTAVGRSLQWEVESSLCNEFSLFVQGVESSEYEGVELECQFISPDGSILSRCAKTTVFECHAQPIENAVRSGYEVVNPSYLSTRADSVFAVSVKPDGIPDSKIRWRVSSGNATFASGTTGTETTVKGVSGMADLEVEVLGATDDRMHFRAKVQQ